MSPQKRFQGSFLALILMVFGLWQVAGAGMTGSPGDADYHPMMAAARNYVKAHSATGITFDLKIIKQVNNYALLEVIPTGQWANKVEPAGVILKKMGGKWVPQTMGTDFSDWEKKVPELFKR